MHKYKLRPKARDDLCDILKYTANKYGNMQARKYAFDLDVGMLQLCELPKSGLNVSYIKAGYRRMNIKAHAVYYKITNKQIDIIRILDQRMNPENWL